MPTICTYAPKGIALTTNSVPFQVPIRQITGPMPTTLKRSTRIPLIRAHT